MKEPTPSEIRIRDPLSDVTRKERRLLLGVSVIGIAIVKIGLVPSRISAFGIDFTPVNQKSLLYLFAVIVIYFLAAFIIYSASDFIAWRLAFRSALGEMFKKRIAVRKDLFSSSRLDEESRELEKMLNQRFRRERVVFALSGPVSIIRALFEFLLPITAGLYTILSLILYKP
ncbi:MAG: hypothetical protein ACE144_04410 [Thermodesulfobacteriota bacterium]